MLLVDVMRSQLSVLRVASIRQAMGGGDIDLRRDVKPGDRVTVRIDSVSAVRKNGRRGEFITTTIAGSQHQYSRRQHHGGRGTCARPDG